MKKRITALIIILIIPSICFSQSTREFWGIKYGTTKDSAVLSVKTRFGLSPDKESNTGRLIYSPKTFAGLKPIFVSLRFYENKMCGGRVAFKPEYEAKILDLYRSIQQMLSDKYGTKFTSMEDYAYPYEKGDGHEVTAIKLGKSTIGSMWDLENAGEKSKITLVIDATGVVIIDYEDELLGGLAAEEANRKKLEDL